MSASLHWPRFEPRAPDSRFAMAEAALRGEALLDALASIPITERAAWVDTMLGLEQLPPPDMAGLPPGAVPYLPCGVEEILAMVHEAPLKEGDVLVDLGSGLGRVVMLANLLTGARATGIELQEHLVTAARKAAANLGLDGAVSFVHANAADVELDGTVFFLYAPCNGELLERVLSRIEAVARRKRIVVCTVDVELHASWLQRRSSPCASLTVYDACP